VAAGEEFIDLVGSHADDVTALGHGRTLASRATRIQKQPAGHDITRALHHLDTSSPGHFLTRALHHPGTASNPVGQDWPQKVAASS